MYLAIESRSAWDHTLRFSPALLEELRFWYSNIDSFNGYSLRPPPDSSTVVFSDASDVAFGGFLVSLDDVTASGMFTSEDLHLHLHLHLPLYKHALSTRLMCSGRSAFLQDVIVQCSMYIHQS